MAEKLYHTQMEAARKGILTPEMELVAKKKIGPLNLFGKMWPAVRSSFRPIPVTKDWILTGSAACCAPRST